MVRFAERLTR